MFRRTAAAKRTEIHSNLYCTFSNNRFLWNPTSSIITPLYSHQFILVHPFHKNRCHFSHSLPFNRNIIHTQPRSVRKGQSARLASHAGACGPKTAGRERISKAMLVLRVDVRGLSLCMPSGWMIFRCWGGCCTHPASCK